LHRGQRELEGAAELPRPLFIYCLQPEQSAQQSAEGQHPVCAAAFAVPASPSAITAINNIALNVFMDFSFKWKEL
jgi:hypothetical protein